MIYQYVFSFFLSAIISVSVWATPLKLAKTPTFVDPNTISLQEIPAPPEAGSVEEKIDQSIVIWEQNRRTVYDYQHVWNGVVLDPSYFSTALGVRFEEPHFPHLFAVMKIVMSDVKLHTDAFKIYYKRPRPYQANSTVDPFIPEEESYTYPSGHATRGMTTALVLAELFPTRRDALLHTGEKIGQDRVIGGVHYPSDIEGGVQLSKALAKAIIASDSFKAKVKEAQAEIQKIQKTPIYPIPLG